MKVTTVMVVILIVWCGLTLLWQRRRALAAGRRCRANCSSPTDALGWLKGTVWPTFTAVAILVGFGHSILAMSGEESLAQVYREIERPKVRNLQRAGLVIFVYSLVFTALVSFFAVAIIPDAVRPAVLRQSDLRPGDARRRPAVGCGCAFQAVSSSSSAS